MPLINETGLPAAAIFRQYTPQGTLHGVAALRATFAASDPERLRLAEDQKEFLWQDEFEGDPLTTPLLFQADFIPFKKGTDLTFIGSAHTPDGTPQSSWTCGIRVENRLHKMLRVHGPRHWEPLWRGQAQRRESGRAKFLGWKLGEGKPTREVELAWTKAFGGPRPLRPDEQLPVPVIVDNPLGCGWLDFDHSPREEPIPAPVIECTDEPISDWRRSDYRPQGLAPIPPWWAVRQKHMGTLDDAWLEKHHPLLPLDFSYDFWQCAHPECVLTPWIGAGEAIDYLNLHPSHPSYRFTLPSVAVAGALFNRSEPDLEFELHADGVHADFRRKGQEVIHVTWRGVFPWEDGAGDVKLFLRRETRKG
ncbi:DUF2169 domain-containing protein [Labrys neptuniae]|uniref:DUF2169 family type VI secretion system accessory protein n=1 Tax=Labrys neptuniae TaxID=376174 RepID=UPI00288D1779|nr:DUF2169 domain-containing protein [Labrys neptuniae]MDT3381165.1 DUF2169 domain-containing protein [Labrys neptuniae]